MIRNPAQAAPEGCGAGALYEGPAKIAEQGDRCERQPGSADVVGSLRALPQARPWSWWAVARRHNRKGAGGFAGSEDGGVILWLGLFLGMLAVGALLIDVSMLYVARQRAQIVADAAVIAAAGTPGPIVGTAASSQAVATAANIGTINGYPTSDVATIATQSPRGDGSIVLETTVKNDVALGFGFLSPTGQGRVGANAYAGATPAALPCLWALGADINIAGSAVVDGPNCTARATTYFEAGGQSNVTMGKIEVGISPSVEAGYLKGSLATLVNAGGVDYNVAPPKTVFDNPFNSDPRIATLQTTMQNMVPTWDFGLPVASNPNYPQPPIPVPAAGNAALTYNSQTGVTLPHAPYGSLHSTSSDLTFEGSGGPDPQCTNPTTFSSGWYFTGTNTVTFNSGCYVVSGDFFAYAGSVVKLKVAPDASVVFVLAVGSMYEYGDVTFDDMTTVIRGGTVYVEPGATLTYGNGPWWFWGGSITTTTQTSTLRIGNGPFYMYGGSFSNNGTMIFGNGPFYLQGGSFGTGPNSTTTFGDGPFWFYGGSLLFGQNSVNVFGVGDLWFQGGSIANYGIWTLGANGDPVNGNGTMYLQGGSYAVTASAGGFIARGYTIGLLGGTIYLTGSGPLEVTAPMVEIAPGTPNRGYQEVVMGLLAPKGSTSNGATSIYQAQASSAILSGLIYSPMGNVSIYGYSQPKALPPGGCFQIVANVIQIYDHANVEIVPCTSFSSLLGLASAGKLVE
ncbi:MAG: pilus assembly protein TadG-related protein [Alphaproteobacteria bacterium]|nr:pilus assembly protein TadG-related protein [Alphaproteobacteria bacterium]